MVEANIDHADILLSYPMDIGFVHPVSVYHC
jgi:hypothetical protein